ncbi:MAG TPA: transglutaminase domain-containing protein, partial [Chitinophagaceae bacterium]
MNFFYRLFPGRNLFLFFILAVSLPGFSQTDFADKVNAWKTQFPKADAVALLHKEVISFSLNSNPANGEKKVKAQTSTEVTLVPLRDFMKYEDGLFYNEEVSIDNVKAINGKGKEVTLQKQCGSYNDDDIFHSDARLCVIKFALEEKGKAFTYKYQENYRDIKYLTSFYMSNSIPVVEKLVEFHVPSWMDIDLREFNFSGAGIEKTSAKEGDVTKIVYRTSNVPAYKREPGSPNHAISYPHIVCVSKAYTENGQRKVLFESVKDLYGWYRSLCDSIGNKPDQLKSKVDAIISGKKTDMEKVEAIFYWVQDNIRYIAFEDGIMGFKPDAAQNVFNKKYGDCKGKANLMKEMLKLAGYDARLTWIGTSDLPYDYSLPSLCVDNHMICSVVLNGKRYFLDGTEDYIAINDYAQRIQGKQVLIEDGPNHILDKVPVFPSERNKVKRTSKLNIEGTVLNGSAINEYNGEAKISVQRAYASIRSENKKEALSSFLRRGDDNIIVSNIKHPDFGDRQKPLEVGYDLKANNQVTSAGKELYVVMDWDKELSGYEMEADRMNDFEFDHKLHYVVQTELNIPEGYKVDYLPESFKRTTTDYTFEGSYVNKGKTVVYSKTIIVNKSILKKKEFEEWNSFIKSINKFYN